MAGLSNLIADTTTSSTTNPDWLTTAQADTAGRAVNAANNVPGLSGTTGQLSVNNLNNANNAFSQGQTSLNTIASGAANPWLDSGAPDTSTPMGGLFAAQQNYFNQLLPNVTAPTTAQSIGQGNFGSLRALTANNKAIGDAYNQLVTQQNQAALQNQATGVQAGAGLSNLGQQQNAAQLNTAQFQQSAPLAAATGESAILGNLKNTPSTVTGKTNLSPLSQVNSVASLAGSILGSPGGASALAALGIPKSIIDSLTANNANLDPTPRNGETQAQANARVATAKQNQSGSLLGSLINGVANAGSKAWNAITGNPAVQTDSIGNALPGTYATADGGNMQVTGDGSLVIRDARGNVTFQGGPGTAWVNNGTNTSSTIETSEDGTRTITGGDGSVTSLYPNGYQSIVDRNGNVQFYDSNGTPITQEEANNAFYQEPSEPIPEEPTPEEPTPEEPLPDADYGAEEP